MNRKFLAPAIVLINVGLSFLLWSVFFFNLGGFVRVRPLLALPIILYLPGLCILFPFRKRLNSKSISFFLDGILLSISFWILLGQVYIWGKVPLTQPFLLILITFFLVLWNVELGLILLPSKFKASITENELDGLIRVKIPSFLGRLKTTLTPQGIWTLITKNQFLFALFFILFMCFSILRVPYVPTDDVWFHMAVINDILEDGLIRDTTLYSSKFTYHFLGSVYCFLSGQSSFFVGRYIGFIQFPLGFLLYYRLLSRTLHHTDLCLLICLFFCITAFGTSLNFTQYWPTAITFLIEFRLYDLFFTRLFDFQNSESPHLANTLSYFLLFGIYSLTVIFSHVISLIAILFPLLFFQVFLFLEKRQFLFDLLASAFFFILNLFMNPLSAILLRDLLISLFTLPLWALFLGILLGGVVFFYLWKFVKNYTFSLQSPKLNFISAQNTSVRVEHRLLRPVILPFLLLLIPLIYYFAFIRTKGYFAASSFFTILNAEGEGIVMALCVMGILLYREFHIVGKAMYLYMVYILFCILGLIITRSVYTFVFRILNLNFPLLLVGIGFYGLYSFTHWLQKTRPRKVMVGVFIIYLCASLSYLTTFAEDISVNEYRFISRTAQKTSTSNPSSNTSFDLFITAFHWAYPYAYELDPNNSSVDYELAFLLHPMNSSDLFLTLNNSQYCDLDSNCSLLTNLYLLITYREISVGIIGLDDANYGRITAEDQHTINQLLHLNRIACAQNSMQLYWFSPVK